ncbi:family A G protein-coupled receptor-like protein [Sporormia fimetaria CBS 119925]|uniref:Family A G protein-coupled receptor-like protein n=1 Tax=Sporormia fimetaria CBS 119925 TaxID=1340428 RepID=A0A6A6VQX1_9PLEO|nr:family A G protein-coupled receptor-like protein [Sporormia fimetaria CBS 119925]
MIVEAIASSTAQVLPTHTPTHVAPIPTVLPDVHYQVIGDSGARTLWVVFVIMAIASALFAGWSLKVAVSNRLYHVITTVITIIAAISYFAMATGQGVSVKTTVIHHHHEHGVPDTTTTIHRQVFWARYVDWLFTTPLLLLDLGILAGLSGAHILMAIIADVVMIVVGLMASFGTENTPQKWGNFAISMLAFLVVIWHLALNGRTAVRNVSQNVANFYMAIAGFTVVVWTAYPVVWGVTAGGHLSIDGEIIAYAILDVLAKVVFGAWLLVTHAKLPETNVELKGFWANGLNREGLLRLDEEEGA